LAPKGACPTNTIRIVHLLP